MRRMRSWHFFLLAIPVVSAVLGIQFMVRKWYPETGKNETAANTLKPSFFKTDAAKTAKTDKTADKHADRKVAARDGHDGTAIVEEKMREDHTFRRPKEETTTEARRESIAERVADEKVIDDRVSKQLSTPDTLVQSVSKGDQCASIEYRGDRAKNVNITETEWKQVLTQFHGVKGELLAWLTVHRKEVPDQTANVMETQLRNLKIQRPPVLDEPDLNWRGIGVYTLDSTNQPAIRLGSGFVKLIVKQPLRGRFELARLVAQSWAPCELARLDNGAPWSPLLKCMGVEESQACAAGTYSEGGWAVSSALAEQVAKPGCTVPAFADSKIGACVKKIPLPLGIHAVAAVTDTTSATTRTPASVVPAAAPVKGTH